MKIKIVNLTIEKTSGGEIDIYWRHNYLYFNGTQSYWNPHGIAELWMPPFWIKIEDVRDDYY